MSPRVARWLFVLGLALSLPCVAFAQSAEARIRAQREELDRIRRERADLESRMANLQGNVHDLREEVANLDRQREATERVLQTLDRQLAAITSEVDQTTAGVDKAERELAGRRSSLEKRLVDIYKRGPLYSAEALLTARSFGELVARYKYLHELATQDRVLVTRVQTLRDQVYRQRADLVRLRSAVEENRTQKQVEEDRLARLRGEQRFGGIERAALVDVHEAPLQRGAPRLELALLGVHPQRRLVHVARDRGELSIEGLDDALRRLALAVEVGHLVGQLVHVALKIRHPALELRALAPDAVQLLALRTDPRLRRLCAQWSGVRDAEHAQRRDHQPDATPRATHTRRRCLPTDTALPSSPISAPNNSPSNATRGVKKIVWIT